MEVPGPKQVILVGHRTVELPPGVAASDWALERTTRQNPRIRCVLYCTQALEEVLDGSYFLLHCSEAQVQRLASQVGAVVRRVQEELGPLLLHRPCIPALEEARRKALGSLQDLEQTIFPELFALSESARGTSDRGRRQLAMATGQLHGFLQETLGILLAADPRSRHDADYFLSRRFARHVREAEFLYGAVCEIATTLQTLGLFGPRAIESLRAELEAQAGLPDVSHWRPVREFVGEVLEKVVPKLQAILVMPGIRMVEARALDRICQALPLKCAVVTELQQAVTLFAKQGEGAKGDGGPATEEQVALTRRLSRFLGELAMLYSLLLDFAPPWQRNLERRRALMLAEESSPAVT